MNIYILSDPIQSGKTTALRQLCSKHRMLKGILTPVINGKRFFEDIQSGILWNMEAYGDEETIDVGRHRFSAKGFKKANDLLAELIISESKWIILDEIGPLELQEKGFAHTLRKLLMKPGIHLLLVVREGLVEKVKDYFSIDACTVITSAMLEDKLALK